MGDNRVNWITEEVVRHAQLGTHLDALSHLQIGDRGYNGWTRRRARRHRRASAGSAPRRSRRSSPAAGSSTRRARGVDARARRRHRRRRRSAAIEPTPGDAVLFHTGWGATGTTPRPISPASPAPGSSSPSGWPSAASRSPAATRGATGRCRPRTRRARSRCRRSLNVHHGVFIVENLDTAALAADGVREFAPDPDPPEAARRHRRLDLTDRPRLNRRDAMSEHYDVIIIGTGAGGGTLAHRLAPGQADPAARARRLPPARARELGHSRRSSARSATSPTRSGSTRTARRSARTSSTSSAATRSSTARSCSASASGTSARSTTTAASRRRGRSPTHDLEPYYARGRGALPRPRRGAARTRPSRRRSGPFPYPAVSHEPRIQQLARRLRAHRPSAVPPAGRRRPGRVRS